MSVEVDEARHQNYVVQPQYLMSLIFFQDLFHGTDSLNGASVKNSGAAVEKRGGAHGENFRRDENHSAGEILR